MSALTSEPHGTVDSMEELFAVAAAMEQQAIDGYCALAGRMRREGRSDLAEVFDRLVDEEKAHLAEVGRWSDAAVGKAPDGSVLRWDPGPFDDEGAGAIAPELLSAYRAFAIAVRNAERAFAFWSYLAAQAGSAGLRAACERMAREELAHVATLRRERRRAFHLRKAVPADIATGWTAQALERRLAELLGDAAKKPGGGKLDRYAAEAGERAAALVIAPLGNGRLLTHVAADAAGRLPACAELLFEFYLDLAGRLPSQEERDRAQTFAAQLLDCLSATRAGAGDAGPS